MPSKLSYPPKLGRIEPTDWKHVEKYPLRRLGLPIPDTVESILHRPALRPVYDQKNTNGCTGFSATWMMSIYNSPPTRIYDALWLYHQGTIADDDPTTNPQNDAGGYVWAVFEVLRTQGHVLFKRDGSTWPPRPEEGIHSYYWCTNVDEMRTAIHMGRPVVLGINWYESFMQPKRKGGRWWIGEELDWGYPVGGHAICLHGMRDSIQAGLLINTWGVEYPPVWISYNSLSRLLSEAGEAGVAHDK